MPTSPSYCDSNTRSAPGPAPIWSAPCFTTPDPSTPSNATCESSKSSSITRHVWVVQHRNGWWLDPQGIWTDRLEWAWWLLDPHVAAARVQRLGIDLAACQLVPLTLTAHPATPWQWHADG